ncbi:DUF262 domain-containing protein [Colwellia demingiae]|uniref:DUF262 domain-containing protein n=1 Tax=Colwellia demingiae TaxID=89401 RepID=A0A5C6QIU5_9GAMM|nr:DUF262 domain-containing protein [Colwellia demingiae]TWX68532.1 DUF262 domain-containing protein [Colwellia demingiae]
MASFDIDASRYVLGPNSDKIPYLLNNKIDYIIPIYQRPYAWTEKQITQFINDIFSAFSEQSNVEDKEPMFIGTMQLAKAKNGQQEIIDGQQRFTTFFLLFKVLEQLFPSSSCFDSSAFLRLKTKVNNGEQQILLEEFREDFSIDSTDESNNIYCNNSALIFRAIKLWLDKSELFSLDNFPFNDLHDYINRKIYFVVIETQAGLSKTLKIFDTINTAGLPLDTNDLFKIRMYEYLQKVASNEFEHSDDIFSKISSLYEDIDHFNKAHNSGVTMQEILGIYQVFLIAKYNLPTILYSLGVDTFYDRLFETLFNISEWPHFKKEKGQEIKLCLHELKGIVTERLDWHVHWKVEKKYSSVIDFSTYILWSWTRYARYRKFIYIFLFQFKDDPDKYQKLQKFINALTKLYIVYSVNYQRVINNVRFKFNHKLLRTILSCSKDESTIISLINDKLNGSKKYEYTDENFELFNNALKADVFSITTSKNLLCRMSAVFAAEHEEDGLHEVTNFIFNVDNSFDIEHILSQTEEENEPKRDDEWKQHINKLGNIVLLERNLNRGINNHANKKVDYYEKSQLSVIKIDLLEKRLNGDFKNWNIDSCNERTTNQVEAISTFVFSSFK